MLSSTHHVFCEVATPHKKHPHLYDRFTYTISENSGISSNSNSSLNGAPPDGIHRPLADFSAGCPRHPCYRVFVYLEVEQTHHPYRSDSYPDASASFPVITFSNKYFLKVEGFVILVMLYMALHGPVHSTILTTTVHPLGRHIVSVTVGSPRCDDLQRHSPLTSSQPTSHSLKTRIGTIVDISLFE